MNRRSFVGLIGAAGAVAAAQAQTAPQKKGRCYLLQYFMLKIGTQQARLTDFLSKSYLPALAKLNATPALVLEASLAQGLPHVLLITGYASAQEMWNVREKLAADKALAAASDAWEAGPELPFESTDSALLEAADYSPDLVALNPAPKTPRTFEVRVYHTSTFQKVNGLHWLLGQNDMAILRRCGAEPVLFGASAIGAGAPNLTWITAFADEAARDKAWAAFAADPEWVKVRAESTQRFGNNPAVRDVALYRSAAYSPIL